MRPRVRRARRGGPPAETAPGAPRDRAAALLAAVVPSAIQPRVPPGRRDARVERVFCRQQARRPRRHRGVCRGDGSVPARRAHGGGRFRDVPPPPAEFPRWRTSTRSSSARARSRPRSPTPRRASTRRRRRRSARAAPASTRRLSPEMLGVFGGPGPRVSGHGTRGASAESDDHKTSARDIFAKAKDAARQAANAPASSSRKPPARRRVSSGASLRAFRAFRPFVEPFLAAGGGEAARDRDPGARPRPGGHGAAVSMVEGTRRKEGAADAGPGRRPRARRAGSASAGSKETPPPPTPPTPASVCGTSRSRTDRVTREMKQRRRMPCVAPSSR